ncbi:MAG TPA: GNAT family N-acetyltransferase [Terriglobales bacterium]|nr:GNAT family N-acetyltransferase [Terriglobales bacterium]
MKIRPANAADIAAIVSVVNTAFSIESFLEGKRTNEQVISETMQKGIFFVGEDETGHVIASVYVENRGDHAYLGMLAIDPSRQGTGLARQMTEAAEAYCRKQACKYIEIVVLSLRPDLLPLYRKLGFIEIGTKEFHPSRQLKPGFECHGIIMTKAL